jgi:hypothetical protein
MATTLADRIALWAADWTAGETKTQTVCFDSSYSAATHSLRYEFRGEEDRFGVDCTDTGTSFRLLIPAGTTRDVRPGEYMYVGYCTTDSDSTVTAVDGGAVTIRPNPVRVSHAQRCLQAVRARIEGRATSDQLTIQMGDVMLQHMTMKQLLEAESVFSTRVRAEMAEAVGSVGTSGKGRLLTEFIR